MKSNLSALCASALTMIAISFAPQIGRAAVVQDFESGLPAGSTVGDARTTGTFEGIAPAQGSFQLQLTTIKLLNDGSAPLSVTNDATDVGSVASHVGVTVATLKFDGSHTGQEGSAFKMTLNLNVGDVVSFKYDFLTAEDPQDANPNQDFGFASLVRSGTLVNYQILGNQTAATTSTGQGPFFNETGTAGNHFSTYQFSITTAGTYTLGIGVMDARFTDTPSSLLVDAISVTPVPEPSTLGLIIAGAVSLVAVRRRMKKV